MNLALSKTIQVSKKPSKLQSKLLKTMKEYGDPITAVDLALLLQLEKQHLYTVIYQLKKKGFELDKIKDVKDGRQVVLYQLQDASLHKSPKFPDQPTPINQKSAVSVEPKSFVESKSFPCTKPRICFPSASLISRCYHLIHAKISISSTQIADFFNLSDEQAVVLVKRTCKEHSDLKPVIYVKVKEGK